MLEFKIVNMSCGHCQLKVTSVLKEEKYPVDSIDMEKNTVCVDANIGDKTHITKILDKIGYLVDQDSFKDLGSHLVQSKKLDNVETLDCVIEYLNENGYKIEDIRDDLSIVVTCSVYEKKEIDNFVEKL